MPRSVSCERLLPRAAVPQASGSFGQEEVYTFHSFLDVSFEVLCTKYKWVSVVYSGLKFPSGTNSGFTVMQNVKVMFLFFGQKQ